MTDLATKDLQTLINDQATAIQALADKILDFNVGSVELAFIESNAAVVFWLQDLIVKLLSVTRLATSVGEDVDSFLADYQLKRLEAVAATGLVTFSRSVATQQAVVPVGAQVQSLLGSQLFTVYADITNINYNVLLAGYVLPPGTLSIQVPVRANVVGTVAGNVAANTITAIVQGIPGVSNVTNPLAFTNGLDAETDAAAKIRFALYIQSLSKATLQALEYAIDSVQQGLTYKIVENKTTLGATRLGYFYAAVDDGTGALNTGLSNRIAAALEATRGFTIAFSVTGPTRIVVTISMSVKLQPGADEDATTSAIQNKLIPAINTLGFGAFLPYNLIPKLVFESSTDIINVTGITLNSGTADLQATNIQEFYLSVPTLTINYI